MELTTAILCDFAQVRDRLLFVSSGAVSRLYRRELPSALGVSLGLVIEVPREAAGVPHVLRVRVVNRQGAEMAGVQNTFQVGDQGLFPNEIQQVPMVISLARVPVRTWGTHQVRLYLDDQLVRSLTCYVVPASGVIGRQQAPAQPQQAPAQPQPAPAPADAAPPPSAPEPQASGEDAGTDEPGQAEAGGEDGGPGSAAPELAEDTSAEGSPAEDTSAEGSSAEGSSAGETSAGDTSAGRDDETAGTTDEDGEEAAPEAPAEGGVEDDADSTRPG